MYIQIIKYSAACMLHAIKHDLYPKQKFERAPENGIVVVHRMTRHSFVDLPLQSSSRCIRCLRKNEASVCICRFDVVALGHSIRCIKGCVFCYRCGAYSFSSVMRGVQKPCKPPSAAESNRQYVLSRLKRGVHPQSGKLIGDPVVPVQLAQHAALAQWIF